MTWVAPRTWVVGDLVTAAMMNTHLRDNLLSLKSGFNAARAAQVGFSNSSFADTALTGIVDDWGGRWSGSANFTTPWAGRFWTMINAYWSGATGGGGAGVLCEWTDSGGTVQDEVFRQETGTINQSVSAAGAAVMASGDKLRYRAYNSTTGAAGSLVIRVWVAAMGAP